MTLGQKRFVTAVGLLLVIALVLWFLSEIASKLSGAGMISEIKLPVLVIAGVLTLLIALAITSVAFALLDLSDKSEALALPKGSVRAVIALALVVIFAIISIYLYSSLITGTGELKRLVGVSREVVSELQKEAARAGSGLEIVGTQSTGTLFTVLYRSGVDRDAAEFAKQLLILIGTLVTSVASFYFGSQSVAAARTTGTADGPAASVPVITSVSPSSTSHTTNPIQVTILGNSLLPLKEVRLVQGTTKVSATVLSSNSEAIVCNIDPTAFQPGAAEIEVESSGGTTRSPITLT